MPSIVVLSGPVGAGKSTVAPALVQTAPGPTVVIDGDIFWSFFAKADGPFGHGRNFEIIMRAMIAAAVPFATAGYETIVDFSIPPGFLDTARKIAAVREIQIQYVVLCPSERTCAVRAANRPAGAIADYSRYHEFYADFAQATSHIIDNESITPAAAAAQIRARLAAGKLRI